MDNLEVSKIDKNTILLFWYWCDCSFKKRNNHTYACLRIFQRL